MGHYASEVDYYDDTQAKLKKKAKLEENLKFWQSIVGQGHIDGGPVEQHWKSIIDWYKVQLYDLRHV